MSRQKMHNFTIMQKKISVHCHYSIIYKNFENEKTEDIGVKTQIPAIWGI